MTRRRAALATCAALPDLDNDDRLLTDPLAAHGIVATPVVWDDPAVDWHQFDAVVLRSTWDYCPRRDDFLTWARSVPRLINPADIVAWNTDKRYLSDLARSGVPVVPTIWVEPDATWAFPAESTATWVIKPTVSAGSKDAGRYDGSDPQHRRLAADHVRRLQAAGRQTMIQPYVSSVDEYGETALIYLDGEFSHAIRKGPMLTGPDRLDDELFVPETITARRPTDAERACADQALAAVPGGAQRLLYARVDLLRDDDGNPVVIELELTEPSLFFATAPGAAQRFAAALAARLS